MKIDEIFKKCTELTMSKRHDYTSSKDNHENFKRSAQLSEWFKNNDDKSYVILIGTKLARLASLLDSKNPKHESIEDTFLDLINYCALWMERRTINEIFNCAYCFVNKAYLGITRDHQGSPRYFCCDEHLRKFFENINLTNRNSQP